MKDALPWVALIAVIVYFSLKEGCNGNGEDAGTSDTLVVVVERQTDTSTVIFNPTIPTQEIRFNIPPLQSFDSTSLYRILDNYFAKRTYKDTLSNDTIYIAVETTVQENKVTKTKIDWRVKPFSIGVVLPPEKKKNIPELKTMIGGDKNHFVAAFGGGIRHKNGYQIGAMYDVVNSGVYVSFDTPLRLPWKKK